MKKSPEKFWRFKNNAYLCSRFQRGCKSQTIATAKKASLAQLARARDL